MGIMILALATRHRVERPAMGMEGGTLDLWSGFAGRRLRRLRSFCELTLGPVPLKTARALSVPTWDR